jgi:lysophospholipase L1-like esterase
VRLSNRYGAQPVDFGAVSIARRLAGADLVPRSTRVLRFAGQASVTIPAGGEVVSDPRRFRVRAFEDVVVSMHVTTSGPATEHVNALQTSYVSPASSGDHTTDEAGAAFTQPISSWPFLTDVEVRAPRRIGGVVALGDSITEGHPGPADANVRYPDLLARRVAEVRGLRLAVQNAGIGGNSVLRDGLAVRFGPSLLDRLDADAIDQAGAKIVILMEGTNDLGLQPPATAAAVITGLQNAVDRLRLAGFRVILGTQAPCNDPTLTHGSPSAIAARNEINEWIRTMAVADGVVDFHAVLRDPANPDGLLPVVRQRRPSSSKRSGLSGDGRCGGSKSNDRSSLPAAERLAIGPYPFGQSTHRAPVTSHGRRAAVATRRPRKLRVGGLELEAVVLLRFHYGRSPWPRRCERPLIPICSRAVSRRSAACASRCRTPVSAGNSVLRDGLAVRFGPSLLDRLDADAIDQAGAKIVILMEGTNDLGLQPPATAAAVITGLQNAVDRLRLAGFRVILGTQAPCNDPTLTHGSPSAIAARNEINEWIRTMAVADGVVDFHAVLRDPANPDGLLPAFDSGDHLHPSAAGYQAMADAVDLNLMTDPPCLPPSD